MVPETPATGDAASREARLLETAKKLLVDLGEHPVDEPFAFECELALPWIEAALAKSEGKAFTDGSLRGELTQQSDGRVLLRAELDARFRMPCARCLGDAEIESGGPLVLTYVPLGHEYGAGFKDKPRGKKPKKGEGGEDAGLELTAAALDELTYEAPKLDLAPMIREQLLLAIPMKALCSRGDDCRGLCGRCGNELNDLPLDAPNCPRCGMALLEGVADIEQEGADKPDSPWKAALRKLTDEGEEG